MLRTKTSAGGIVYRERNGEHEVILIKLRGGSVLTLPKGTVDRTEELADTAVREVREETGVAARIEADLGSISYWFYVKDENVKYRKTVHYYLMRYLDGDTGDHDAEVEDALWFRIDEALQRVAYRTDRQILERARTILRRGRGTAERHC